MSTTRPVQSVSRRTVAKGATWIVPSVLVATAAPAYAVSPGACAGVCYTLVWTSTTRTAGTDNTGGNWARSATVSPPSGTGCTTPLSASISQNRTGGFSGAVSSPTSGTYNYSRSNERGDFSVGTNSGSGTVVGANSGLVLSQSNGPSNTAQQTVTFNFGVPVQSVSFTIYDLTTVTTSGTASNYSDQVSFSRTTTLTRSDNGGTAGGLRTTSSASGETSRTVTGLNEYVYRSGHYPSDTSAGRHVTATVTMNGANSFQMNYRNMSTSLPSATRVANSQWIVLSDLRVCL